MSLQIGDRVELVEPQPGVPEGATGIIQAIAMPYIAFIADHGDSWLGYRWVQASAVAALPEPKEDTEAVWVAEDEQVLYGQQDDGKAVIPLEGAIADTIAEASALVFETAGDVVSLAAGAGMYREGDGIHNACCAVSRLDALGDAYAAAVRRAGGALAVAYAIEDELGDE